MGMSYIALIMGVDNGWTGVKKDLEIVRHRVKET